MTLSLDSLPALPSFVLPVLAVLVVLALTLPVLRAIWIRRWLAKRCRYGWLPGEKFDTSVGQVEAWGARILARATTRRVPAAARAVRFRVDSIGDGARYSVSGPPQVEQIIRSAWPGVEPQRMEK